MVVAVVQACAHGNVGPRHGISSAAIHAGLPTEARIRIERDAGRVDFGDGHLVAIGVTEPDHVFHHADQVGAAALRRNPHHHANQLFQILHLPGPEGRAGRDVGSERDSPAIGPPDLFGIRRIDNESRHSAGSSRGGNIILRGGEIRAGVKQVDAVHDHDLPAPGSTRVGGSPDGTIAADHHRGRVARIRGDSGVRSGVVAGSNIGPLAVGIPRHVSGAGAGYAATHIQRAVTGNHAANGVAGTAQAGPGLATVCRPPDGAAVHAGVDGLGHAVGGCSGIEEYEGVTGCVGGRIGGPRRKATGNLRPGILRVGLARTLPQTVAAGCEVKHVWVNGVNRQALAGFHPVIVIGADIEAVLHQASAAPGDSAVFRDHHLGGVLVFILDDGIGAGDDHIGARGSAGIDGHRFGPDTALSGKAIEERNPTG